jgi:hypothetical protein
MMSLRRSEAALLIGLLLLPAFASAQNQDMCFARFAGEMSAVHDEYRSHLFGSRFDRNGLFTILTGGTTDKARTGIFETKGRLTSELVEPIVESYRAYRCKTIEVCQVLGQSFGVNGGLVDIKELGCVPVTLPRYTQCYFAGGASGADNDANLQSDSSLLMDRCRTLARDTLSAERAALKVAVAYDSGYRSLLQFAGMMDWVLTGFPTATVRAIADMVNLLGKLHQIPCFIGQCDHPDSSTVGP